MKKLQNTLYVTQPDVYLSLDGDNVVLLKEQEKLGRVPLHNLESIVAFGYTGASPALMGYCADHNVSLLFLTMNGRFLARVTGESRGTLFCARSSMRCRKTRRSPRRSPGISLLARSITINGYSKEQPEIIRCG